MGAPHPPHAGEAAAGSSPEEGEGGPPPPLPEGFELSVAPMMAITTRHFRALMRMLSARTVLWTEMMVADAVLHRPDVARFSAFERPLVAQLGGSDPAALAAAARALEAAGYDEVNLNLGCPSNTVVKGCFGAVLMKHPETVAACLRAMRAAVAIPVTAKIRIGVDRCEGYEHLRGFVGMLADCGVAHVVVHARKAILGLSTTQNRSVPPLNYAFVYDLVRDFPHVRFTLNGGVRTLAEVREHARRGVHGVMIGRAAYKNPLLFADVDRGLFGGGGGPGAGLEAVLRRYGDYCDEFVAQHQRGETPCTKSVMRTVLELLKP